MSDEADTEPPAPVRSKKKGRKGKKKPVEKRRDSPSASPIVKSESPLEMLRSSSSPSEQSDSSLSDLNYMEYLSYADR